MKNQYGRPSYIVAGPFLSCAQLPRRSMCCCIYVPTEGLQHSNSTNVTVVVAIREVSGSHLVGFTEHSQRVLGFRRVFPGDCWGSLHLGYLTMLSEQM